MAIIRSTPGIIDANASGVASLVQTLAAKPILDSVPSFSAADAAYGLVKLRTAYTGNCIELRNLQSSAYVTKQIGFTLINGRYVVNVAEANAFDLLKDAGAITEGRFLDQSGNGNDTTIAGSHIGFYWGADVYGNPVLQSVHSATNTSSSSQALALPSAVALNNDAYSAIFVGSADSSWFQAATHIYELASPRTRFFAYSNSNSATGGFGFTFGGSGSFAYETQVSGPALMGNVISAGQIQTLFNGNTIISTKTAQAATSAGGNLGWSTNGVTVGGGFNFNAMLFYNRTLAAVELQAIRNWAYQTYPQIAVPAPTTNLIVVGESITEGITTKSNQTWPFLIQTLIKKRVNLYVAATSGQSYSNWESNLAAITSKLQAGMENIVCIFGCCWNEINQGKTPAQAYTNLQTLVTNIKAAAPAGATVKVIGTGQSAVTNSSTSTVNQGTFWTALEGGNSFFDAFYDLWTVDSATIGSTATLGNTTYYAADQIHLTAPVGHEIVAEGLAAAFNSVAT